MSDTDAGYDERRSRCFLDQSSNVATPIHEIVGAPAELQRRYADLPEVADLLGAVNALAATGPSAERAGREALAGRAERLQADALARGRGELAQLLGHAAEYLRGVYPLRPVRALPTLHLGG